MNSPQKQRSLVVMLSTALCLSAAYYSASPTFAQSIKAETVAQYDVVESTIAPGFTRYSNQDYALDIPTGSYIRQNSYLSIASYPARVGTACFEPSDAKTDIFIFERSYEDVLAGLDRERADIVSEIPFEIDGREGRRVFSSGGSDCSSDYVSTTIRLSATETFQMTSYTAIGDPAMEAAIALQDSLRITRRQN